jgi:hypothetical protein
LHGSITACAAFVEICCRSGLLRMYLCKQYCASTASQTIACCLALLVHLQGSMKGQFLLKGLVSGSLFPAMVSNDAEEP